MMKVPRAEAGPQIILSCIFFFFVPLTSPQLHQTRTTIAADGFSIDIPTWEMWCLVSFKFRVYHFRDNSQLTRAWTSSQSSNCLQKILFTMHEMRCLHWTTAQAYLFAYAKLRWTHSKVFICCLSKLINTLARLLSCIFCNCLSCMSEHTVCEWRGATNVASWASSCWCNGDDVHLVLCVLHDLCENVNIITTYV